MNLLGASNLFMKVMRIYSQLKYIKTNSVWDGTAIKNIYNRQTQYDDLLENIETLYGFSNTKDNIAKLQAFLLRYEEKIKKEYMRVRSLTGVEDEEEISVKVKPLVFGIKDQVENKEDAKETQREV